MNEVEWLSSALPGPMLDHLDGKTTDRKLRLFACACVRRHWSSLRWPVPREAAALAERMADGLAPADDVATMLDRANASAGDAPMFEQPAYLAAAALLIEPAIEAARTACEQLRLQAVRETASEAAPGEDEARATAAASGAECRAQAEMVREVIGNPFRPVKIEALWLRASNGLVASLARLFAEEGRYAELPYLADALEDAGCTAEALVRHLREPSGHARGCWALDLLLGNE